jgi:hypothetical protein
MVDLLVRVRAYVSEIDLRKLETATDLRIGRRFDNLKKGHTYGIQMSVA